MLTRTSVHCAERIVATSSSSGLGGRARTWRRGRPREPAEDRGGAALLLLERLPWLLRPIGPAFYPAGRECDAPAVRPGVRFRRGILSVRRRGASSARVTLTILHTSDLHGRVHPHDALADPDLGEGLARIATAVAAVRAEGRPVLLLDSGDTIQGAPSRRSPSRAGGDGRSDRRRDEPRRLRRDGGRQPRVRLRSRALRRRESEARFPWLSANTVGRTGSPPSRPTSSGDRRRARRDPRARHAGRRELGEPDVSRRGCVSETPSRRAKRGFRSCAAGSGATSWSCSPTRASRGTATGGADRAGARTRRTRSRRRSRESTCPHGPRARRRPAAAPRARGCRSPAAGARR